MMLIWQQYLHQLRSLCAIDKDINRQTTALCDKS